MKKKTKQFLLDKYAEKWIRENKGLLEDYQKLCSDLMIFRFKWGIEIGFILKNPEEIRGEELGVGMVDELFGAQKATTNKD